MELNVSTPNFTAISQAIDWALIKNPFIAPRQFYNIMARYDSYALTYNTLVRELRKDGQAAQTLKSGHRAMFQDFVNQIKGQMERQRRLFADTPNFLQLNPCKPYALSTNRAEIKRRTGKDGSTAWRNIQRLHEAGIIILKENHGTRSNFELHMNPVFLLISDHSATTDAPVDFLQLASENRPSPEVLRAECTPFKKGKNSSNNKTIDVDNEYLKGIAHPGNGFTSLSRTDRNIDENTGELGAVGVDNQGHSSKTSSGAEEKERKPGGAAQTLEQQIAKARMLYAQWLVQYMQHVIFPNHKHYKAAILGATEYAEIYFHGCKTSQEFSNRQVMLLWRVDAAAKWAKRSGFDFSNIYLQSYLDMNNKTSGFVNTEKWWKSHVAKKAKEDQIRKHKSDYKKLSEAISRIDAVYLTRDLPLTAKEFGVAEQYVGKIIPYMLPKFYELTKYIRYDWYS